MTKNMGGIELNVKVNGMDEAIEKAKELNKKLEKAKTLLNELANMNVDIKFTSDSQELSVPLKEV